MLELVKPSTSKIILPLRVFFTLVLLVCLFFYKTTTVRAEILFSDSFSGGYNDSWQVAPGRLSPIPSTHGIGAASSSDWSDIIIPINEIAIYNIQFDLWINIGSANSVWRLYMINNTYTTWTNYKIINNWGLDNLLQVSERIGVNILNPWNHNPGPHHFEITFSPIGDTDITVIEDGVQVTKVRSQSQFDLTYIGVGLLGLGDNEMSNFVLSKENIVSTPSPSPIPTFTPTPTSTPIPTNKVVVIPGLWASWNVTSLLSCGLLDVGEWTLNPLASYVYNPLFIELSGAGYETFGYFYDWREQVKNNTSGLSELIQKNTGSNEKINIVGHSMGGLVARSYVEQALENSKVEKLLTVGSPHRGSPLAYSAWAAGEYPKNDILGRFATTLILKYCGALYENDQETVHNLLPSVQNLLPIDDYLHDFKTGDVKPAAGMLNQNNWLPTSSFPPYFVDVMGTLTGTGRATVNFLTVKDPNRHDIDMGNWSDGKVQKNEEIMKGDGTVLVSSSSLPGIGENNIVIPQDHIGIVNSSQGISEILNFLGTPTSFSPTSAQSIARPQTALMIIGHPASLWVTDPTGKITKDSDGLVAIVNPKKGSYRFLLLPKEDDTELIVIQLLENGQNLYKRHKFINRFPKIRSLEFDTNQPSEDILK
jgi:pimeloyl-ACP methyl ester carboxylesterase